MHDSHKANLYRKDPIHYYDFRDVKNSPAVLVASTTGPLPVMPRIMKTIGWRKSMRVDVLDHGYVN